MDKKLLTYFLLLFLAVAMPSCSNDNDNDEPTDSVETAIVGTWRIAYSDGTSETFMFREDKTFSYIEYEVPGEEPFRDSGIYHIQKSSLYNNKYILTLIDKDYDDSEAYQIISLSKNKLVLRDEGLFEGDDPDDDIYEYTRVK